MKYYALGELNVTDPSWVSSYVANVTRMVEAHGGRYLARTSKLEKLEGERKPPQVVLLVEWPSREAAMRFYDSDDYRPFRELRVQGAVNELTLVAGEDVTGAAKIGD